MLENKWEIDPSPRAISQLRRSSSRILRQQMKPERSRGQWETLSYTDNTDFAFEVLLHVVLNPHASIVIASKSPVIQDTAIDEMCNLLHVCGMSTKNILSRTKEELRIRSLDGRHTSRIRISNDERDKREADILYIMRDTAEIDARVESLPELDEVWKSCLGWLCH